MIGTSDDGSDSTSFSPSWLGYDDKTWEVHKFGGTSVANADCIRNVAKIVEEQIGIGGEDDVDVLPSSTSNTTNLAVVVSAMGGKPKVTDLLLNSVAAAAKRDNNEVKRLLDLLLDKHEICLKDLFDEKECNEMLDIIRQDIDNIRDILRTVSLMKWEATRISELISGHGELWNAQIVSRVLRNRARNRNDKLRSLSSSSLHEENFVYHEFVYIDARRIITIDEDAIQDGAVSWAISKEKLEKVYAEEWNNLQAMEDMKDSLRMHFVITGYVASNMDGVPTTLQRDGSDYTASIIGKLLRTISVSIWTDVSGVLSADPRRVPDAHPLKEISFNEAIELAYFGAKVIHPKTMQPAISSNPQIPIYIRNTFKSKMRGTRIYATNTSKGVDEGVCGFASIDNMALINVEGSGLVGVLGIAKRLFGTLDDNGINVILISQASSQHSITFATLAESAQDAKNAIEEEFHREFNQNHISTVDIQAPCSIIAAVGDGMYHVTGVAGRFFTALGDAKINVLAISQGSSERNISAVVRTSDSTRALRAVHAAFRLSHSAVRVGVVGMNEIGISLLKLLESQRAFLRKSFEIDLQVCAVLADCTSANVACLGNDDGGSDSITYASYQKAVCVSTTESSNSSLVKFEKDPIVPVKLEKDGMHALLSQIYRDECPHHVIFDCTNDIAIGKLHPQWLNRGVHVVTANNTALSSSKDLRDAISLAEKAHGKSSAHYLREVTVGGGLPIISTLRALLSSGDKIRRIDGILSVSMSFIMFRISPPPNNAQSTDFDKKFSKGVFEGDMTMPDNNHAVGIPCLFSEAVKEAIELGLMEENPTFDLTNEYSARVLMVLAKELGLEESVTIDQVINTSDKLVETQETMENYKAFAGVIDEKIQARVQAATDKGCVLRHVCSIDVKTQSIEIKIEEVPNNHVFAVSPPSTECVRFFTHSYETYPLVVQGPAAGADSTSSALLAELLQLMRSKMGTRYGAIARTSSSAFLSR